MPRRCTALVALCVLTSCPNEYDPRCTLEQAPTLPGFQFTRCNAKFEDEFRARDQSGRWSLRIGNDGLNPAMDVYLPLDAVKNGTVAFKSEDTASGEQDSGWVSAWSLPPQSAPGANSGDTSGSATITTEGTLPTDHVAGEATIEVDFTTPLTLSSNGGTTQLSGKLRVKVKSGGSASVGGGGEVGPSCAALLDEVASRHPGEVEGLSCSEVPFEGPDIVAPGDTTGQCAFLDGNVGQAVNLGWAASCMGLFADGEVKQGRIDEAVALLQSACELKGNGGQFGNVRCVFEAYPVCSM